jgi:hypothetical protein
VSFVRDATPGHEYHVHVVRCAGCAVEEWHDDLCRPGTVCKLARRSGGVGADVFEFDPTAGLYRIALSNKTRFELQSGTFSGAFCAPGDECLLADVNYDGVLDVIDFRRSAGGEVWVGLGDEPGVPDHMGFATAQKWHDQLCIAGQECRADDLNNDGLVDLVAFDRGTTPEAEGDVWVALSNGHDFGPPQRWHDDLCHAGQTCLLGDLTGDFRADALVLTRATEGQAREARAALNIR